VSLLSGDRYVNDNAFQFSVLEVYEMPYRYLRECLGEGCSGKYLFLLSFEKKVLYRHLNLRERIHQEDGYNYVARNLGICALH
jgi:hypothetical protein